MMRIKKLILVTIVAVLLFAALPTVTGLALNSNIQITKNELIFAEDGSVTAEITFSNKSSATTAYLIFASYKQGSSELVAIDTDTVDINKGYSFSAITTSKTMNLSNYPKDIAARNVLYVWDNSDKITPLLQPVQLIDTRPIVVDGSLAIEAEDIYIEGAGDSTSIYTYDASKLSGGKGVQFGTVHWNVEDAPNDIMRTEIHLGDNSDPGVYKLWLRARTNEEATGSLFMDLNTGIFTPYYFSSVRDGEYRWSSYNINLTDGDNYIACRTRTRGIIDKFIITNNTGFTPTGIDDYPEYKSQEDLEAEWALLYDEPPVTPPVGVHPRLFIREDTKDEIKANALASNYSYMYNKFIGKGDGDTYKADIPDDCLLDTTLEYNHNGIKLTQIISRAFQYVMGENNADSSHAKKTIMYMRNYLTTERTPDGQGDITRERGDTLMAAAIVYDWCYDQLTADDKAFFKENMIRYIASKETGWPPTKMSNIASHAGEQEIFRDLLAAGIALYDEYPLLYNMAAGRMYQEMIPARKFFRQSGFFDIGTDYGEWRHFNELWADITMKRMLPESEYESLYGDIADSPMMSLIYARLPYGSVFPVGDSYSNTRTVYDTYYKNYPLAYNLASSLYGNEYLENEFRRRYSYSQNWMGEYEQFFIMLFDNGNDTKVYDDLPLARATTYPYSSVTARTSWQEGFNSDAAVAFMDMHEVYIGDHQHKYTGDFQLYYKGLLAMNTGTYNASNQHNDVYSHRSPSANTMVVVDPDEVFEPGWTHTYVPNDGGQRNPYPNKSVVNDLSEYNITDGKVTNRDLIVSEDVKSYIGPNTQTPEISYVSGDLTNAYSDKVVDYNRSMVFVDLNNDDYPAAFVVYDKIESANKDFTKKWLLHSEEAPQIDDTNDVTIIERTQNGFGGRLVNKTLLPENVNIASVGGDNNEMYYFTDKDGSQKAYLPESDAIESGKYRIEVSPASANTKDTFLNAMYVTDAGNTADISMTAISHDRFDGVLVNDSITLMFNKTDSLINSSFTFAKSGTGSAFIAGLAPGMWSVTVGEDTKYYEVTSDSESLYFKSASGSVTVAPAAGNTATVIDYPEFAKRPIGDFTVYRVRENKITGTGYFYGNFVFMEYPGEIYNNTAYIPVTLLKEFGCDISLYDESGNIVGDGVPQKAIVTKDGKTVTLTVGQKSYDNKGTSATLAEVPVVLNNMIYIKYNSLPKDFLGYELTYSESNKNIKAHNGNTIS